MRALVLGGGGVTGIAWELGLIAGLRRHGVDLTGADVIIGTSAGAYVGALIATGVDLDEAMDNFTDGAARVELEFSPRIDPGVLAQGFALVSDPDVEMMQKRIGLGTLARAAPVGDDRVHVERFAATLPVHAWPRKPRLVICAVDCATGELADWDAEAEVPLPAAVAASCALPGVFPPVEIDGGHFMDGGVRSVTNGDLAAGAEAVVMIAPSPAPFRVAPEEELAALGVPGRGLVLHPDDQAREAIGGNILDPGRRGPALDAGFAQAATLAPAVGAAWAP
jgi:NTE family protein